MNLCRVQIENFRNFASVDVCLNKNVVLVGENRIGKSNFIFALRLVLDYGLSDASRQLKRSDFWDGCEFATKPEIRIHLDFCDFDDDADLITLLTDYRLPANHTIARLSFAFVPKADLKRAPESDGDYEFKLYGGDDINREIRPDVRRRLAFNALHALRDAEGELANWRSSPLRPLLDDAVGKVSQQDLESVANDVLTATRRLEALGPISALQSDLRTQMANIAGQAQAINPTLGFAPVDALRLFRSIGLFIDDGKRSITEASLGSANLALLTLRLAEFEWRRSKNERSYTVMCVEEPEAHLHPHLQRRVFQKLFASTEKDPRDLIVTTHSPNIASVAPLQSLVMLKATADQGTKAFSLAAINLDESEHEDVQRYIDTNRADILFSRGVLFVEGEAELVLLPSFAAAAGFNLDELGITVCSVGGVHFEPYVKLAANLHLPFAVITDWDPLDDKPPLGRKRAIDLINVVRACGDSKNLTTEEVAALCEDDEKLRAVAADYSIFMNRSTFEIEVANTAELLEPLLSVLRSQQFGAVRTQRLDEWMSKAAPVDGRQLLAMIADVGKGRFAGRLSRQSMNLPPPDYIYRAVVRVTSNA